MLRNTEVCSTVQISMIVIIEPIISTYHDRNGSSVGSPLTWHTDSRLLDLCARYILSYRFGHEKKYDHSPPSAE